MKNRIKTIRRESGKTQKEFAEYLGFSLNYIGQIECGTKVPSERTIKDICRAFDISEEWLKNGTGEMKVKMSPNIEIADFLSKTMKLPDDDFQKRFVRVLSSISKEEWETIEDIVSRMIEKD